MPPPLGTSRPDALLSEFDVVHEYTDAADRTLCYVGRIEARDGRRKQFVRVTYGTLNGLTGWHKKGPDNPLPLYGLNRLATMPEAPVLLCEGEKAADAAQAAFLGHACVSWYGGTGSVEYADLTPLQGRDVIIWPDADEPGAKAVAKLAKKLLGARVLRVDDLEDGADAADVAMEDPEAWLAERLPPKPGLALRDFLSVQAWAERPIPPPDRLLGDLVTTTTRMFLVGRTGLGKTMVGFALACGMASGEGFLHWRSARPARVLYIDGEMPGELIKARAADVLRRASKPPAPGNLVIYSRDAEDDFAARFPTIGRMPPLNTEAGHNFITALMDALGGVDVIVFDNVMSLVAGDQKDELAWADTMPLISALTARRTGQIWLDHTGHNTDRQYGSATKAWRFDAVGIMAPLQEGEREPHEVAFTLSFDHPGKARRRTPENWHDFQGCTIRLRDDMWTSETETPTSQRKANISATAQAFHRALLDALAASSSGATTRDVWTAECVRLGLVAAVVDGDTHAQKERKRNTFRKYVSALKVAGWIGVDGDTVRDLTKDATT